MKSHIKPFIVILMTLVIGFGLGIFTSGYFFKQRVDRFTRVAREEGFIKHHVEMLEATETQQSEIRPILEKHYRVLEEYRNGIRMQFDSMRMELRPYLTEEQLEKMKQRRRKMRRPGKRRKGPPPPGPDSALF